MTLREKVGLSRGKVSREEVAASLTIIPNLVIPV
jgi:hypothetical protein